MSEKSISRNSKRIIIIADVPIEKGFGHYSYVDVIGCKLKKRGHAVVVVSNKKNHEGFVFGGAWGTHFDVSDPKNNFDKLLLEFDPEIVLFDTFPFGMFNQESYKKSVDLYVAGRSGNLTRSFTVIRDIWSWRKEAKEFMDCYLSGFSAVLVRGNENRWEDKTLLSEIKKYRIPLLYCGFIVESYKQNKGVNAQSVVLVHQGGSLPVKLRLEKAGQIMDFFKSSIKVKKLLTGKSVRFLQKIVWKIYVNPLFPLDEFYELRLAAQGDSKISVLHMPLKSDFLREVNSASLVISRAGYNTTLEMARSLVPRVIVPFVESDQEQMFRSEMLSEMDIGFSVLSEPCIGNYTSTRDLENLVLMKQLKDSIEFAIALRPKIKRIDEINCDGAEKCSKYLEEFV